MSKTYPLFVLLTGLALSTVGCDSQASQQAEAQRHLDAAVAKLRQANAGYIADPDSGGGGHLLVYRQESMDAAFEDLNKVLALDAPSQKVQALRISADIEASAARHASREAALEDAALNARSTVLMGYLAALEGAAGRAKSLEPQTELALTELQAEVQEQNVKRERLTAEIEELETKLQAETAEVERYQAQADEGYAKTQALRDKAFVAKGDAMYELQDEASKTERQAAVQSASAERHQVMVDDLSGRLNMSRLELDTVNRLIAELTEQITTTRADAARQNDLSAEAAKLSDEAVKALSAEYALIAEKHAEVVRGRMTWAGEKADKAVADLKQAASLASGQDAESVNLQLLAAYVDQAHLATNHAAYVANLAHLTGSLLHSVKQFAPGSAGVFEKHWEALSDARQKLDAKAGEAIAAGIALAEELAPEGSTPQEGGIIATALAQKDRLNAYDGRRRL